MPHTRKWFTVVAFALLPVRAPAAIVEQSGDLLSQVVLIRNNMPGSSSEGFVKPTATDLQRWRGLITTFVAGDYQQASDLVASNFPSYQLIHFTDTGLSNQTYYLLRESFPVTNGWGTVVVRPDFERNLCIESPHPVFDINTDTEGADIFRRTGARFFILAGTHRCANVEHSPCDGTTTACGDGAYHVSDPAHFVNATFQVTHETLVAGQPQLYTFNLHGNSSTSCEDLFLSNGRLAGPAHPILFNLKTNLLAQGGLTVAIAGVDASTCTLTGGDNVQGRFSNGSASPCSQAAATTTGYFIHIEQHRVVRDNVSEYAKLIHAITTAVPLADTDGDGQSNAAEHQAGTSPTNSASFFGVTGIVREDNDTRVTWMTGIGKTNALERSSGAAGSFSNNFAAIFTVTNTVGSVTNYLDMSAATNVPSQYYRIRLVP